MAERLRLALADGKAGPSCLVLDTVWGRFVLRAYSIADSPQVVEAGIAVRIQRQEPALLKFVDALGDRGLTPMQREVAVGLAKGCSNREIATALRISINTVAYHVKELFQRLDAHDRRQMIATVLVDRGECFEHRADRLLLQPRPELRQPAGADGDGSGVRRCARP